MKKSILIITATLLLVTGVTFADVTFDKNYKVTDTALATTTYQAVLPNLTFSQASRIAEKIWEQTGESLVIDEQSVEGSKVFYKTVDNSAVCKVDRLTGDVFYRKYRKFKGSAVNLPEKAHAKKMAKAYLEQLGLFKKDMGNVVINTLNEAVYDGQTTQTFEKMRVVTFTRKLGGIPVLGASRAAVMLGTNGELEGLVVRWMEVTPKLIRNKVAKSQLKNHIKAKLIARKIESNVLIKKSNLIIFDDGKGNFEPRLHLEGEVVTSQGNFFSDWMVPVTQSL